ncbi:MAG: PilZ domain-containing protein [Candidatus Omnitrophica bacterium]|nr:PilZ domain-containing protein [Candidatus Omnitrophota bacterium]
MGHSTTFKDQRKELRISSNFAASISIGSQLTVQGQLKDLSFKSAFIKIKNSIFLQSNDEVGLVIQCSSTNADDVIESVARVSRIVVGEGIAVYFTKMNDISAARLRKLLQDSTG